jgi:hypothetical protein
MAKIVYNSCYGGFSLSERAAELLAKRKGWDEPDNYPIIPRHDADLVAVVEELGLAAASGRAAELSIRELPDGERYRIDEYDGSERVMTPADYEWILAE